MNTFSSSIELVGETDFFSRAAAIPVFAAINLMGAFLVGIATSPQFPRRLAPLFVTCFRIFSSVISVDAYVLLSNSKQVTELLFIPVSNFAYAREMCTVRPFLAYSKKV